MSTQHLPSRRGMLHTHLSARRTAADETAATSGIPVAQAALAALRVGVGFVFLWAFLDKTFGLGYTTTSAQAWINGGSPTKGFLGHVDVGPLTGTFHDWAGQGWADWLFMLGMLGVGVAVILGIGLRVSALAGTVIMALMWLAEFPPAQHLMNGAASGSTNPVVDYHVIYALGLIAVAALNAGDALGLGRVWARLPLVKANPWLR